MNEENQLDLFLDSLAIQLRADGFDPNAAFIEICGMLGIDYRDPNRNLPVKLAIQRAWNT